MRFQPTALGWIDPEASIAPVWERAQVARLARQLGYMLEWPSDDSVLSLVDVVIAADVDALITPAPNHLDALLLDRLMHVVTVETVWPRTSFDRWCAIGNWA
ncbi:hypothetical protein [Nocardia veterana]|uniref:Uncharacterized protein n=1 Tax=Nocardia veterana TaxID=132249 RepID=A0A7X6LTR2_9NOCA|nr:hypothetical protein [Nocardia veterana]NKY84416.1 hypothetical protein [Nocardia veterana]